MDHEFEISDFLLSSSPLPKGRVREGIGGSQFFSSPPYLVWGKIEVDLVLPCHFPSKGDQEQSHEKNS
jgi:hypothetical protein